MSKFVLISSTIGKGKSEANVIYTAGRKLRLVGIPTDPTGKIRMDGSIISFLGCFEIAPYFVIRDPSGKPVQVQTTVSVPNPAHIDNFLPAEKVILPVAGNWFEGFLAIIPVSDAVQTEERTLDFYFSD